MKLAKATTAVLMAIGMVTIGQSQISTVTLDWDLTINVEDYDSVSVMTHGSPTDTVNSNANGSGMATPFSQLNQVTVTPWILESAFKVSDQVQSGPGVGSASLTRSSSAFEQVFMTIDAGYDYASIFFDVQSSLSVVKDPWMDLWSSASVTVGVDYYDTQGNLQFTDYLLSQGTPLDFQTYQTTDGSQFQITLDGVYLTRADVWSLYEFDLNTQTVPEPATLILASTALLALARKRKSFKTAP